MWGGVIKFKVLFAIAAIKPYLEGNYCLRYIF